MTYFVAVSFAYMSLQADGGHPTLIITPYDNALE